MFYEIEEEVLSAKETRRFPYLSCSGENGGATARDLEIYEEQMALYSLLEPSNDENERLVSEGRLVIENILRG